MNLPRNICLEKTQPCDTSGKLLLTTGNLSGGVNGIVRFSMVSHVHCPPITPAVLMRRFVGIETPVPVSLITPKAPVKLRQLRWLSAERLR
jgi:hypothetical protein